MVLVGYFLARCGRRGDSETLPPAQLDTDHWSRAYTAFFAALSGGRTLQTFANSLKNARDLFDARVDSGRVGWRQGGESGENDHRRADSLYARLVSVTRIAARRSATDRIARRKESCGRPS